MSNTFDFHITYFNQSGFVIKTEEIKRKRNADVESHAIHEATEASKGKAPQERIHSIQIKVRLIEGWRTAALLEWFEEEAFYFEKY
jgi:hypothetical protein